MLRPPYQTRQTFAAARPYMGRHPCHQSHHQYGSGTEEDGCSFVGLKAGFVERSEGRLKAEDEQGEGHYPQS